MNKKTDKTEKGLGVDWQGSNERWEIEGFSFSSFLAGVMVPLFFMVIL